MFGAGDVDEPECDAERDDEIGMSHVTYEQHYRACRVWRAGEQVHLDRAGRVSATNGQFQPNIALDNVTPSITGAGMPTIAQSLVSKH